MDIQREKLKNEIQGSGFLSQIKDKYLPDSTEMSRLALNEYQDRHGELSEASIRRNFSYMLEQLLKIERELYDQYEKEVYRNALVYFLQDYYQSDSQGDTIGDQDAYPETYRILSEIEDVYDGDGTFIKDFQEIIPRLYPIINDISVSASQARRKRAGLSLNNHVINIIEAMSYDISLEAQFGNCSLYQVTDSSGIGAEDGRILLGFHTTLSDRYRQTLTEDSTGDVTAKFLATASGKGVITDDDRGDITHNKINDIQSHDFKLLAFKDVKSEFRDHDGILSYEAFASRELPSITGRND